MTNKSYPEKRPSSRARNVWIAVAFVVAAAVISWMFFPSQIKSDKESKRADDSMAGMVMPADGQVQLTASQISEFGVTFDTARVRTIDSDVRATATIALDETRIVQITPKFAGYIERLYVNSTGQAVRRGQPVAAIFSPELLAAQQELLVAAGLDRSLGSSAIPGVTSTSPSLLASARQRLRLWDIPEQEINAVLRTGQPRRTVTLYAPASGVVTEKTVVQGQSVTAGMPLMTVADISTVWAITELREADSRNARIGAVASVEVTSFPGERIPGRITYVYPMLDMAARTISARVVLPNPGGRLKPGMFATVTLSSPQPAALTVPASAMIETGERSYVFVRSAPTQFTPREVRTGRRGSGFVEIISGLNSGQIVVSSAQFLLESESNIGEVMRSMLGQGADKMTDMKSQDSPGLKGAEGAAVDDKGADMKGMQMPPATRR